MEYRILKTETDRQGVQNIYYDGYKPLDCNDARSYFYRLLQVFLADFCYKVADIKDDSFVLERSWGGSIKFEIVKYE